MTHDREYMRDDGDRLRHPEVVGWLLEDAVEYVSPDDLRCIRRWHAPCDDGYYPEELPLEYGYTNEQFAVLTGLVLTPGRGWREPYRYIPPEE